MKRSISLITAVGRLVLVAVLVVSLGACMNPTGSAPEQPATPPAEPGGTAESTGNTGTPQWARTLTAGNAASVFLGVAASPSETVFAGGRIRGDCEFDFGNGVAVDHTGNVVAAGTVYGNADVTFDGGHTVSGPYFGNNPLLVKYNALGEVQWARTATAASTTSYFSDVAVDETGAVYAVGSLGVGTARFSSTVAVAPPSDITSAYLVKFDVDGTIGWARTVANDAGRTSLWGLAMDGTGRLIAGGSIGSATANFGNGATVTSGSTGAVSPVLVQYR